MGDDDMNLELEKDLENVKDDELVELSKQVNEVIDRLSKLVVEKVDKNEKEL